MGATFSYVTIEWTLTILLLDAAGKTIVLYKLELGEVVTTVLTIGETIDNRDLNLQQGVMVGGRLKQLGDVTDLARCHGVYYHFRDHCGD